MSTLKADYGVSYESVVTKNRTTTYFTSKRQAIEYAKKLLREGARRIRTFRYEQGIGAVDFEWRNPN